MATMQGKETFGRARLSFAQEADVDEFVSMLARFEAGEIGPDEWRAFRLLRGTYGQRQTSDAQMMRVKIPQGVVDAQQLEVLAGVGERYSRGFGHITTRQNVQFHFVKLHDAELAMRELAAGGITTREACGNSVRNITACPYAGVAPDEAVRRHALRRVADALPAAPSAELVAAAQVQDRVRRLRRRSRRRRHQRHRLACARQRSSTARPVHGFRVTVAGGTATMVRAGLELHEFLPADQMFDCAEAIIRVFHRLGDYKHKQRNRLKFLVKALGWDTFRAEYEKERTGLLTRETPALPFERDAPPVEAAPPPSSRDLLALDQIARRATATTVIGPGIVPKVEPRLGVPADQYRHWAKTNVRPQKQSGYSIVIVATLLGDLTSAQMRLLGDLASSYGDGTVRVTVDQNLVFRWVRTRTSSRSTAASRLPACRGPAPGRCRTSPAAPARSRASSP